MTEFAKSAITTGGPAPDKHVKIVEGMVYYDVKGDDGETYVYAYSPGTESLTWATWPHKD